MRVLKLGAITFLILFILNACNKEKAMLLTIKNIPIKAEGPLFEGVNTAQGEVMNQLQLFAKENGIDPEKIHSARLKKITLKSGDSINFDLFTSINIQFASDKTEMMEAASFNNLKPGIKMLESELSGESKNMLDILKQDKFYIVADAIISKDSDANIELKGDIEVELIY